MLRMTADDKANKKESPSIFDSAALWMVYDYAI